MSDREDFRRLVGDDEYRRLLRIAQSCDGNLDVMQELYHERIAGTADPDPEARAMRRVLSMQAERLRSLSSECDELRYEIGSGHAAKEALASLCESADALSKLLADVLEPLQRRWCHMFNDAGVCGLCELTKLRDAYEASRKEVSK